MMIIRICYAGLQWQGLFLTFQNLTQETNAYARSIGYTLSTS